MTPNQETHHLPFPLIIPNWPRNSKNCLCNLTNQLNPPKSSPKTSLPNEREKKKSSAQGCTREKGDMIEKKKFKLVTAKMKTGKYLERAGGKQPGIHSIPCSGTHLFFSLSLSSLAHSGLALLVGPCHTPTEYVEDLSAGNLLSIMLLLRCGRAMECSTWHPFLAPSSMINLTS